VHDLGAEQRMGEDALEPPVAGDLAPNVADQPSQAGAQEADLAVVALDPRVKPLRHSHIFVACVVEV
jgi:hypothetical protein